jgi:long-chain acyl-CoA synthetase
MEGKAQVGVRCGARSCSYPQLFERAMRATSALHALGIDAGDRVALLLRNSLEFLEASIATAPLGAGAVPINWHWRSEEIAYVLRDSKAKALVVHADLWPEIADSVPREIAVLAVPVDGDVQALVSDKLRSWPELLDASEAWGEAPQSAPSSIIYTSGTTGRPKGVVRAPATDAQREAVQGLIAQIFQLQEGERTLIPAPMYHTAPNVYALAAAMRGMDMTIMTGFDAEEFLRLVERQRVSVVQMVPTMFVRLLSLPERVRNGYDLSSLRWIVHAAAPCPPEVKRAMIEWLGPIVAEYYGSTETGPVVFCDSEQWLAHPGTVGRALEGALIEVLDADGRRLAPGESGEVFVRLDVWPDFTYEGDARSRLEMERHGLVSCGDIGYLDDDGYLYLNDRRSDMVISGGVNIYPAEVEACLHSLAGVRDCAVFGIPDDEFGEVLAAHVEAHSGAQLSADAVREHVRANLAAYKTPRVVQFSDSLPREDSGKIFKRRLREPYWAGRERAI